MANIDIGSPADNDLISQFPTNERASRTAVRDLFQGLQWWGGTAGGTADALEITVDSTHAGYVAGSRYAFKLAATNTTVVTLNVNGLGTKNVRDATGATLAAGSLNINDLVEVMYTDDGHFRVISGLARWMNQQLYDDLYPLGKLWLGNDTDTPAVPNNITATWTLLTGTRYLVQHDGTPAVGGTGNTTSSDGSHTHSFSDSGTTDPAEEGGTGGFELALGAQQHRHDFSVSGTTGSGGSHTHTIDPLIRTIRVWERTA